MRKKERQLSELNFSQTFTSGHLKDIFETCQDSRFCLFCAIMQCIRVLGSLFDCMATILKLPAKTKNWPGQCLASSQGLYTLLNLTKISFVVINNGNCDFIFIN